MSNLLRVLLVVLFLYLPVVRADAASLELTADEQAWLEQHPVLRVSGPRSFPPFSFVAEDRHFKGMADEYLVLVGAMIGVTFEYHPELFWSDVLAKIEQRELDIITCAAKSPEREQYLDFANPHLSFPIVIINRKDSPFVSGLSGLYGKRIALTKGVVTYDWLKRDGLSFEPVFVSTMVEALEQVSLGRADATVQNLASSTYLIEKQGISNLKVAAPTPYGNYDLSIAIRNDWPELVLIFNKALAQISNEKHAEIRQKWIAVRYEHGVRVRDIMLWTLSTVLVATGVIVLVYRWNRRLALEIHERKIAERKNAELIGKLTQALEEIKSLEGILPLCSFCKKIRVDDGCWEQVDVYIHNNSQADVSHTVCPDCTAEHYPELRESS